MLKDMEELMEKLSKASKEMGVSMVIAVLLERIHATKDDNKLELPKLGHEEINEIGRECLKRISEGKDIEWMRQFMGEFRQKPNPEPVETPARNDGKETTYIA